MSGAEVSCAASFLCPRGKSRRPVFPAPNRSPDPLRENIPAGGPGIPPRTAPEQRNNPPQPHTTQRLGKPDQRPEQPKVRSQQARHCHHQITPRRPCQQQRPHPPAREPAFGLGTLPVLQGKAPLDRKSTRLNS